MKPLIKWVGGKAEQAPRILELFAELAPGRSCAHVEPFAGGLAVFLARSGDGAKPIPAVISDTNLRLIAMYRAVRDIPDQVIEALRALRWGAWPDGELEAEYNAIRATFNAHPTAGLLTEPSPEHAAMFLWINRHCFNGLYRVNKSGLFTTPTGDATHTQMHDPEHLRAVSRALAAAVLVVEDAEQVIRGLGRRHELDEYRVQVYADPPFVPAKLAMFAKYTADGFSSDDQIRVARALARAVDRPADVIASNHDVPFIRGLYGGLEFVFEEVEARRSVSASGSKRGTVSETLLVKAASKLYNANGDPLT